MESKSIEYKQKRESLIIDFAGNHFLNQFVPTMKVQNMYDNDVTLCHNVDTWSKYKQILHYFFNRGCITKFKYVIRCTQGT